MTEKATSKNTESILIRLDAEVLLHYRTLALEKSTPEKRITAQELMRQVLAEKQAQHNTEN